MLDMRDKGHQPDLDKVASFINNPVFQRFCTEVRGRYACAARVEFSSCAWEPGWNVKFRKSGKTLCTVYPREGYFTVLVVVGQGEREPVESILPECTPGLRELYRQTRAGNGQRWLMIDLEDQDALYDDVLRLIDIRRG